MTNRLTIEKAIDKITGVDLKLKSLTEKEFVGGFFEKPPEWLEGKS